MALDKYYLKARLFPTLLTAPPIVWSYHYFIAPEFTDKLAETYSFLPATTNTALSGACIFLLIQLNRFVAKEVFQRLYFKEDFKMPSTDFLLKGNDVLDKSTKSLIEAKVKARFGMKLLSANDEANDEARARKAIVTAVSQIKDSLRGNSMLQQHNVEYGFVRNLLGGALLALLTGLIICLVAHFRHDHFAMIMGVVFIGVYCLPVAFSKIIIGQYGSYYAKVLYEQFLAQPDPPKA